MARVRRRRRRVRRARPDELPARPGHRPRPGLRRQGLGRPQHALREHDSRRGGAGAAGRSRARAARHRARPLECDRDRAAGERRVVGARRPHRELPVRRDAVRGRLQPLLARALPRARRRPRLHAGPLVPGHLLPRLPRGAADRGEPAPVPAGGRRGRALLVSAPLADARLLAVPHRLDGPRPADGDLPGQVPQVHGRARHARPGRPQGVGVHGRRRDGRAGVDGRHLARRTREARQPHLRRQLQPAAPRRPRARQREDHPGARDELPRRRLERDQGDLGVGLGHAPRRGRDRDAPLPDGGGRRRRVPDLQVERRRVRPGALLRQVPRDAGDGGRLDGRRDLAAAARRPRPEEGLCRLRSRGAHDGAADGDPGEDDQGLRHGAGRRGPQHHAPAEVGEGGGAARDP